MMKIKAKKQRNKSIARTQPDERYEADIRVSLADPAKQKLIQESFINNHLLQSRSRDWDQDDHSNGYQLKSFNHKRYQTMTDSSDKGMGRKNYKLYIGLREVDHLKKMNKTQQSMRDLYDEGMKKGCNSINLQFQNLVKERETRIHSNGQVNIQFDNNSFNISEKILRETAFKTQNQFNKTHLFYNKNMKRLKDRVESRRPMIPFKKLTANSAYLKEPGQSSFDKGKETRNELSRRKEFLDLRSILMEQKRNLFYPTKMNLTTKSKAGRIYQ